MNTKIALVIPCFNEAEAILDTINILTNLLTTHIKSSLISPESFLLFVDDGSNDDTFSILKQCKTDNMKILKLSANKGHQYALLAGLQYVFNKADCCISIDADLQDDLSVIEKMILKFQKGYHIVCGVRKNRDTDTFFKKITAQFFYKLMGVFGVNLVKDHADFRMLSNRALCELNKYQEYNLFLRGIFTVINLKLITVEYTQGRRKKGKSKYNLTKMLSLAIHGITSFSTAPIRIITIIGLIIFLVCIILSVNVLFVFLTGESVPGWASITLPLYFLGGIQILSLGILGEYIAKIYKETKGRPHYHIDEIIE
ncbi:MULTISPECIES: glycosyltransferase family 2 protein [unclassified Sphingobacterium]|uniref:glycosyltransferase family 2 protein n=1 Tax=unclassified Sphingobacterium TaxID=2609468 RepID=UPI001051F218|nr:MULTISPECIES: glycosyltransferase family 2 protein [unclassified Sphingobacterium]MCS3556219.1 glycosyltransferase involved in cell wall biosynthesis [Sphingobacterium sp. JUb21]TCR08591.1 glycosyltransferase involved in cell wall biosynthesis [Sphingobacterium sp. JUb20]